MEFKEEYWSEALSTLRREERKALVRRWMPWLGLLLLLGGSGAGLWALSVDQSTARALHAPTNQVQWAENWTPMHDALLASDAAQAIAPDSPAVSTVQAATQNPVHTVSTQQANSPAATAPAESPVRSSLTERPNTTPSEATPPSTSEPTVFTTPVSDEVLTTSESTVDRTQKGAIASPSLPTTPVELRTSVLNGGQVGMVDRGQFVGTWMRPIPARFQTETRSPSRTAKTRSLQDLPLAWKQSGLFTYVGNSLLTGFGSRTRDLRANPEIGVGYEWVSPNPHWSVKGSLGYFQIGGITHAAHFDQHEAGFGLSTTRTTIQTETLHFAYVPLEVNWNATRHFSLTTGAGISYLVNSLSEVVVSQFDHDSNTELERFEDWGYVGGYKTINASLLGGAEWRPNVRWALGAQYQHGLTRITKSDIYQQAKQDRNSRLRLYLKFTL